mmetsp:Transcript_18311/g.56764  ORF Transcript_18311/g.56764 Transcript_18311/m.56764 type:complete len:225 (+) Transcript_18311:3362-4036(+)
MCERCSTRPTVGASLANLMSVRLRVHERYSSGSLKTLGAVGCQMPTSGKTTGSPYSIVTPSSAGTYVPAIIVMKFSRFSLEPPSQYCSDCRNLVASLAFSAGRYLSTLGSVRMSLSRPSSKLSFSFFCFLTAAFMKLPTAEPPPSCAAPSCAIEKVPSLLSFITAGIEGKMRHASRRGRSASTTTRSFSARSSTKMSEPMKMLAAATSFLNVSKLSGSRSSSSR